LETWKVDRPKIGRFNGGWIDPVTSRTAKNVGFARARKRFFEMIDSQR
jgi:hypothetical protein